MKPMRVLFFGAALILAAGLSSAEAIEAGEWINLFDGESLYGWTTVGDGNWDVSNGQIELTQGDSGFIASNARFTDFELKVVMRVTGQGTASVAFRTPLSGHAQEEGAGVVYLNAAENDNVAFSEVLIRAVGNDVQAAVNGQDVAASTSNAKGHIAIQFQKYHRDKRGPKVEIKEVALRPVGLRSLFNGENLDGWNIIPERKSVFSVIDGALNIKDGNGQIETAEVFRDFILQLDIISNGEHLNSGVFFRGPVGVFWKGYEAQVRNQWMRDDREKPVDFGTGGIYGVNAARKVVSTDHEWFNMTIVACGNHMAAWVNGYQVSDFTDTRPVDDGGDGKNGYVPTAGTIHLQGHDPSTDLSFKNIHLQEYPGN